MVIDFHDSLPEKFRSLLGRNDPSPKALTYDTAFNVEDFYLSVLAFPETALKEEPIEPVSYMLYNRKYQECHVFRIVYKFVPELKNPKKGFFGTDEETGVVNAIRQTFPKLETYRCWRQGLSLGIRNDDQ